MDSHTEELRIKYIKNLPEGMSAEIRKKRASSLARFTS